MENADAIIRQVMNGTWVISSLVLFTVLVLFLMRAQMRLKIGWADGSVLAALALVILVCGHFIRSLFAWIEFIIEVKYHALSEFGGWLPFALATLVVLVGKMLCIYIFSRPKWRTKALLIWIGATITIPGLVLWWSLT